MNNDLRDPLEKVSNSLRRAVTVNKCRESDLRNAVSTIQREQRRTMSTWALKQEKFLRARQRLAPAMHLEQSYRKRSKVFSKQCRNIVLTRGSSPFLVASNFPVNSLPPVLTSKKPPKQFEIAAAVILATDNESQESEAKRLQAKVRRFTEYRQPHVTFDDAVFEDVDSGSKNPTMEGEGDVALDTSDMQSTKQLGPVLRVASFRARLRRSVPNIIEHTGSGQDALVNNGDLLETGHRNRSKSEDIVSNSLKPLPPILSLLPKESEQINSRARQNWRKLRESLSKLTDSRKRKTDISKMTLAELTRMFEDIKECRYLRVGNHTSYRGDSEETVTCKCLACALKDKSKLRNHMSAPE